MLLGLDYKPAAPLFAVWFACMTFSLVLLRCVRLGFVKIQLEKFH